MDATLSTPLAAELAVRKKTRVMTKYDKVCAVCGKDFIVPHCFREQKTCGRPCSDVIRKTKKTRHCALCSAEFIAYPCDPKKYCSHLCASLARTGEGHNRWIADRMKSCHLCGKQYDGASGWRRDKKYCSIPCARQFQKENGGSRHVALGTVYQEPGGYRFIKIRKDGIVGKAARVVKTGWVPEHRVIVEQAIERPLTQEEIVHHRNGNKGDNRIENLQVMTREEHMVIHDKAEKIGLLIMCGELEINGWSIKEILEMVAK